MAEIPESQLTDLREIYRDQTGKTFIYFGKWTPSGYSPIEVAVKLINTQGMIEPYTYIEECSNQLRLDSPHVCKIYGWNLQPQRMYIVMEKLEGDLSKEIAKRRGQNYFYKEPELIELCCQVVSVFVQLQEMHISHNDIKAENIFVQKLSGNITYKVGDFGSASTNRAFEHHLTGTPLYLSPILKKEFKQYTLTKVRREIHHHPFKSDVFSLGVTLIFAAELIVPNDLLEMELLDQKIASHLRNIQSRYPNFANMLKKMLEIDESKRWDFTELQKWLQNYCGNRESLEEDVTGAWNALQSGFAQVELDGIKEIQQLYNCEKWSSLETLLTIIAETETLQCFTAKITIKCNTCGDQSQLGTLCAICHSPLDLS